MGLVIWVISLMASRVGSAQDIYLCRDAHLSFYSSTPVEDIRAESDRASSAIDVETGGVDFKVRIESFRFPYRLMEKHFNERYMQSEEFPCAEFTGKLLDFTLPDTAGVFPVSVEGTLTLHGVARQYRVKGVLEYKDGQLGVNSSFPVTLADHDIRIPKLLITHIAEVVEVKVSSLYQIRRQDSAVVHSAGLPGWVHDSLNSWVGQAELPGTLPLGK